MNNKNRLGRGLSSIFNKGDDKGKAGNNNIEYIEINSSNNSPEKE